MQPNNAIGMLVAFFDFKVSAKFKPSAVKKDSYVQDLSQILNHNMLIGKSELENCKNEEKKSFFLQVGNKSSFDRFQQNLVNI